LHQPVQIPRLMGPMEIAHTDMNNTRRQFASVIIWAEGFVSQQC